MRKSTAVVLTLLVAAGCTDPASQGARRVHCERTLKQIGVALKMYADEYDGAFPPRLSALYPDYIADPETFARPGSRQSRLFRNPGRKPIPPEEIDAAADYEYVTGLKADLPQDTLIMRDKPGNHPDGRHVLYLNGRVGWEPAE